VTCIARCSPRTSGSATAPGSGSAMTSPMLERSSRRPRLSRWATG